MIILTTALNYLTFLEKLFLLFISLSHSAEVGQKSPFYSLSTKPIILTSLALFTHTYRHVHTHTHVYTQKLVLRV